MSENYRPLFASVCVLSMRVLSPFYFLFFCICMRSKYARAHTRTTHTHTRKGFALFLSLLSLLSLFLSLTPPYSPSQVHPGDGDGKTAHRICFWQTCLLRVFAPSAPPPARPALPRLEYCMIAGPEAF